MIQKIVPILPAYNISETNLFYRNKLKFGTLNYGNYLVVKKDQAEIHYSEWTAKGNFMPSSCCLFDDNVEDLYAKFSSLDLLNPKGNLKQNIFGKMEFQITDNNGNILKFTAI